MDVKISIGVLAVLLVTCNCQSSTPAPSSIENTSFVPGVFIPADALKSLQDKAKQSDSNGEDKADQPKVSKKSDQISDVINFPDEGNQEYQQMPGQQQMNPPMGNQNYPPNQQYYGNQPMPNQPAYGNQQPGLNQPPGYQQPSYQQPGYQQPGYQQPGYQQPAYQQPAYQQPGYQQPVYQQNGMAVQPYPSNTQPILVAQQPGYQNGQGMMVNQQPSYQQPMLVAQQPNQQYFVPNGQMVQPNLANNPNNGALLANPAQGQSNLYAMVPVNNQNAVPNPNLGNNAYFVPIQQMPSNGVLMNNGK